MTLTTPEITFHFPLDFDDRAEYEMALKGHLCGGEVEFRDGRRFPVTFFDPVRLAQDLETMSRQGEPAFIQPALVVVPEVTSEVIVKTLSALVRQHFFDHLRPLVVPGAKGVADWEQRPAV
jgi:hypothetical protein